MSLQDMELGEIYPMDDTGRGFGLFFSVKRIPDPEAY